ncbi:DsbA family protein [Sphingomonas sp. LY160]|uniref:DsbA family protein n=1 Tax=Sphingomonas sp. LY160 TaxID=3095342 RepID=UPI002ADEBAD2|nr:DsbA family protein [Sphingomonas sp. LY160]MEA1073150.1 DsbA family protein [Sphingomonas sp. LY160]
MSDDKGGRWIAAIGGGLIGSVATAAALFLAGPQLVGNRMVREALTTNPQILVDAGEALRSQQYASTLTPIRASLEAPFHSSWKGAAKPDVTMTYFFDYACGYCRSSNPDIERLIAEDKGLRVVFKELPILGPDSVAAARVSLAASKAGRFGQYHDALYAAGRPGPQTIAAAAAVAGVSPQPVEDAAQEAELKANMDLASRLGATGTPLFVIGDQVINSAAGYDALKQAVAAARKS